MEKYLTDTYGEPNVISTDINNFIGHKGIILFDTRGLWIDATEHTTLWDGTNRLGGNYPVQFYFNNTFKSTNTENFKELLKSKKSLERVFIEELQLNEQYLSQCYDILAFKNISPNIIITEKLKSALRVILLELNTQTN